MKATRLALLAALVPLTLAARPADPPSADAVADGVRGRYLEARTASVYAGACHYGSEYTTAGREAVLAWRIEAGERDGVSLAGVTLAAVVAADANLAEADAQRCSVVFVPAGLEPARRAAALAWLRATHGAALGRVVAARDVELSLAFDGDAFDLRVADGVRLTGDLLADRACCAMPHDVWYRPFDAGVAKPIVGGADRFRVVSEQLGRTWDVRDANCAFAGPFGR